MAGYIPSFLSAAKVAIRVGGKVIAYAQNISISDDMTVQPVTQIGSYNTQALEPTNYIARGSMTITHYSNVVLAKLKEANGGTLSNAPSNLSSADTSSTAAADGNSLLTRNSFSPAHLMISKTFDIDFYERMPIEQGNKTGTLSISNFGSDVVPLSPIYRLENVRLTNYAIGFTPGSLVNETVSFIATGLLDSRAGEITTKSEV